MKTTLSTIILEESIKASLVEFDLPPKPKSDTTTTTTPKPTPKPKPNKASATSIADKIINSKSWFNDSEAQLINAVNSIPDVKTFWEVNKIIQQKEGKTFSGYISTFISKKEWDVWYWIIKHLTVIIPKSQWKTVIKNVLDKTEGIAALKKKDSSLAKQITKELPVTGLTDTGSGSEFDYYSLAFYGVLTFVLCTGAGFMKGYSLKCWSRFKKLVFSNKNKSGIEVANTLDKFLRMPLRQNKRALRRIMDYELSKDRLSRQEYNRMLDILEGDFILGAIPKQDLNRAFFAAVLKSWQEWSTSKPVIAGEAKKIIEKVDDPTFTKEFGPKLQAIEDRLLGKTKKPAEVKPTDVKIIFRDIKKLGISTSKPNFLKFDMSRWISIMRKTGSTISVQQSSFLNKVKTEFIDKLQRGIDTDLAAKQAILDAYGRGNDVRTFSEIYSDFPAAKQWLDWVMKSKSGFKQYNFYKRVETFPSYEQWAFDMKNAKSKSISNLDYKFAYYNWLNSRLP
jgi:hypothetical protein